MNYVCGIQDFGESETKLIFPDRNIRIYIKINTLKANIWSIVLHGCECWTLTKDLERRLEGAEMWHIKRIMRMSWAEKVKQRRNGNDRIQKIPTQNHQ